MAPQPGRSWRRLIQTEWMPAVGRDVVVEEALGDVEELAAGDAEVVEGPNKASKWLPAGL